MSKYPNTSDVLESYSLVLFFLERALANVPETENATEIQSRIESALNATVTANNSFANRNRK